MAAFYESAKYRVKVVKQQFGENKNGNYELQLAVKPIGLYAQNELSEIDGPYERTIFMTLTEGTLTDKNDASKPGWVLQNLQFLGFVGNSFALLDPEVEGHTSFVGLEFDARCDHEEYMGKEREKWNIVRPNSGGPTVKPAEKKAVRALDARFKNLLKANAKQPALVGAGVTDPGDPPPPPADRDESQIPF